MAKKRTKKPAPRKRPKRQANADTMPRCGLCGKTENLTRTECCGEWICDDEHEYRLFSFARNSCSRNHRRLTLCSYHFNEGHERHWQDCDECRDDFNPEIYVWYGTNEHNFEKLRNPPEYEPTHCAGCNRIIRLGSDGFVLSAGKYYCERCGSKASR